MKVEKTARTTMNTKRDNQPRNRYNDFCKRHGKEKVDEMIKKNDKFQDLIKSALDRGEV